MSVKGLFVVFFLAVSANGIVAAEEDWEDLRGHGEDLRASGNSRRNIRQTSAGPAYRRGSLNLGAFRSGPGSWWERLGELVL